MINIVLIFIIFFVFSSDEAVQNIASLYNQQKLTVTDMNVTGNQVVTGSSNVGALSSASLTTNGVTLNGDLNIKAGQKLNSTGKYTLNSADAISLTAKNGITLDKNTNSSGNLTIGGLMNAQGGISAIGLVTAQGGLSANNIGTDDMIYAGYSSQKQGCPSFTPGQALGSTHSQLWQTKNECYQVCPPGYYMVGIMNGSGWDWKHPLCKKFK